MIKLVYSICMVMFIVGCTAQNEEPSQSDLELAATKTYMKINDDIREIADECRGQGSVIVNPLKALKCTSVCSFDPKECRILPEITINDFEKLACVEAVGQPGWVCDYKYSVSSQSEFLLKMFKNLYGTENLVQGRFFKDESGQWIMAP